jgi:hypothetical protein
MDGDPASDQIVSEYAFYDVLVARIAEHLAWSSKVRATALHRTTHKQLPEDVNALDPDFVVSFHVHAFDGVVSGSEVLFHHRSAPSGALATLLQGRLVGFLGLHDRGTFAVTYVGMAGSELPRGGHSQLRTSP